MKDKLIFRPASETDFNEILKLEEDSFSLYDRLDREDLIELFSGFREGFHMILSDCETIGYSVFLIEDEAGYIESIAVSNKYRRRGVGLLALKHIIKCIIDMNINEINLHVRTDNLAAMSLYEKEGFVKKERVESFYKDGEPAYLYKRNAILDQPFND